GLTGMTVGASQYSPATSAKYETQKITLGGNPLGGTYTLTNQGQTTAGIPFDATPAAVKAALEALSNVGAGNVAVTSTSTGVYTVTFQNSVGRTNLPLLTASAAGLMGGPIAVTLQRAPSERNKIQKISFAAQPTNGEFTLGVVGQPLTDPIPYNASASVVQDKLLADISRENATVT